MKTIVKGAEGDEDRRIASLRHCLFGLTIFVFFVCSAVFVFCVFSVARIQQLEMKVVQLKKDVAWMSEEINKSKVESDEMFQDTNFFDDIPETELNDNLMYQNALPDGLIVRSKRDVDEIQNESTQIELNSPEDPISAGPNSSAEVEPNSSAEVEALETSQEGSVEKPRRKRHKGHNQTSVVAVHFHGDTSKYIYGRDSNYRGNGHLKHLSRVYVDWKQNDWSEIEPEFKDDVIRSTRHNFHMRNGILRIKNSGLYFLYAQIYFLDVHDTNGFRMVKNGASTLLQCVVTSPSHSSRPDEKGNTCYTGGAEYLTEGDEVTLVDLADNRYSKFEPGNSFFGVVKLV